MLCNHGKEAISSSLNSLAGPTCTLFYQKTANTRAEGKGHSVPQPVLLQRSNIVHKQPPSSAPSMAIINTLTLEQFALCSVSLSKKNQLVCPYHALLRVAAASRKNLCPNSQGY